MQKKQTHCWKPAIVTALAGITVGSLLTAALVSVSEDVGYLLIGLTIGMMVVGILFLFAPALSIDIFAPYIVFPFMWVGTVIISSLRLTTFQEPWRPRMWASVGIALVSYVAGMFTVFALKQKWKTKGALRGKLTYDWSDRRIRVASLGLLLLSAVFLAYEYRIGGGIPLLNPQVELVRFDVIVSGYVDTLAMSARIVIMVVGLQLLTKPKPTLKRNWIDLALVASSFVLMITTARRGTFILPLVVIFVGYHYLHRKTSLSAAAVLGILGFLAITLFTHYRYTRTFGVEPLRNAWRPDTFIWMTLGYMTVSDNFRTLRLLTETIPAKVPYQWGRFTTYGVYSVLPGHQENLGEFQNRIWGWDQRYSGSVSTYLGPFYVDFGLVGVAVGSFLIGVLAMYVYSRMTSHPSSFSVLLYSYMAYCLMFTTFSNPFTWTLTYWDIILFALIDLYARKKKTQVLGTRILDT
jgi:oligosaccharide repeat unit polymerase